MENKSHAFWAGLFTIGLAVAIAVTVFFFNVDRTVRVPYDLIAHTNVTGLFTDASVRYRGLGVGKVQSIRFDHAHPGEIRIRRVARMAQDPRNLVRSVAACSVAPSGRRRIGRSAYFAVRQLPILARRPLRSRW